MKFTNGPKSMRCREFCGAYETVPQVNLLLQRSREWKRGEALSQNIVGSNDHYDWLKLSARVAIVRNQKTLWRLTTVVRKPQTSQDACNNESAKRNNMKSVGAGQL